MNAQPAHPDRDADDLLEHAAWVRRLARDLVRDPATADDIVQETWLAFLKRRPDKSHPLRPWLARVVRNQAALGHRRNAAARERDRDSARSESLPSAAEIVERAEAQRAVVDGVLALDEPYRSTLILRYYEGLRPIDIARMRGLPQATVRTHIKRGREQLRAALDESHGGDRNAWGALLSPLIVPTSSPLARMRAPALATGGALALVAVAAPLIAHRNSTEAVADQTSRVAAATSESPTLGTLHTTVPNAGRAQSPTSRATDITSIVLVDAATGSPLEDFAIRVDGTIERTNARGEVSLAADASQFFAIDDRRNAISTIANHGARERNPLPEVSVTRPKEAPGTARIVTGPLLRLDVSPAEQIDPDRLEVLLRPTSTSGYFDDGETVHIAPLRQTPVPGRSPATGKQEGTTWARFGAPAAALQGDPRAWHVTVRDLAGMRRGEAVIEREEHAEGRATSVNLEPCATLDGALTGSRLPGRCMLSLEALGALESHGDRATSDTPGTLVALPLVHAVAWPDASGSFAFRWVSPGDYNLVVRSPADERWSRPITLAAGDSQWIDVELTARPLGGALAGTVTSASGNLREDILLLLVGSDGALIDIQPASWQSNGARDHSARFTFQDAPAGPLRLEAVSLDTATMFTIEPDPVTAPSTTTSVVMLDTAASAALQFHAVAADSMEPIDAIQLVVRIDGGVSRRFDGERQGDTWEWTTYIGDMKWNTFLAAAPLRRLPTDARLAWSLSAHGYVEVSGTEADIDVEADGTRTVHVGLTPR